MAIHRPGECGEESVAELEAAALQNPFMRIRGLHTHYDQVRPPSPLPLRRLFVLSMHDAPLSALHTLRWQMRESLRGLC